MYLETYCIKDGEIISARINSIANDFQAEGWISYLYFDPRVPNNFFKWVLCDEKGIRCTWECKNCGLPIITQKSSRFSGSWEEEPAKDELD
ncbi:MAG: hypothetical protein WC848_04020 [Parcubacteria group bacterium]|jgi:hypothetical protein